MAVAVAEVFAVARVRDDLARRAVDGLAAHAGLCRRDTGQLRLENGLIDLVHLLGHKAERDGPGHIRAVALIQAAEVHRDEIAELQLAV